MPGYPGANRGKITNQPAWMTNCGGGLGIGNSGAIKRAINQRASANCGCNRCKIQSRTNVLAGGVGRGTGEFRPNADGFNVLRPHSHRGPGHIPGHGSGHVVGYLLKEDYKQTNIAVIKIQIGGTGNAIYRLKMASKVAPHNHYWKDAVYARNLPGSQTCDTFKSLDMHQSLLDSHPQVLLMEHQASEWVCGPVGKPVSLFQLNFTRYPGAASVFLQIATLPISQ